MISKWFEEFFLTQPGNQGISKSMSRPIAFFFDLKLCWPISIIRCSLVVYQTSSKSTVSVSSAFTKTQDNTLNVFGPPTVNSKFRNRFTCSKNTNKIGRQSLWGFPRQEITWSESFCKTVCVFMKTLSANHMGDII